MQTVRASFTVPGKNGVAAAYEPNDPFEPDDDQRLGRELRQMRYVNKSELVLREPNSQPEAESVEEAAVVQETQPPSTEQTATLRGQGRALNLNEVQHNVAVADAEAEEPAEGNHLEPVVGTKYAKLVVDQAHSSWMPLEAGSPPLGGDNEDEGKLPTIVIPLLAIIWALGKITITSFCSK